MEKITRKKCIFGNGSTIDNLVPVESLSELYFSWADIKITLHSWACMLRKQEVELPRWTALQGSQTRILNCLGWSKKWIIEKWICLTVFLTKYKNRLMGLFLSHLKLEMSKTRLIMLPPNQPPPLSPLFFIIVQSPCWVEGNWETEAA